MDRGGGVSGGNSGGFGRWRSRIYRRGAEDAERRKTEAIRI
jgi:hypothetical protein